MYYAKFMRLLEYEDKDTRMQKDGYTPPAQLFGVVKSACFSYTIPCTCFSSRERSRLR